MGVSFHLDGHALLRAEDLAPDAAGACQDLGVLVDRRRVYCQARAEAPSRDDYGQRQRRRDDDTQA